MKEDIKFSICIPNFNYAHYLSNTIESVLKQSYQNFEIIVADNASTDNSVEVIEAIKDSRIRLYKNKYNVGFAPNLDKAAYPATGDYIIMLSSDDLMKPDALKFIYSCIKDNNGLHNDLVVLTSIDLVDGVGKKIGAKYALIDQIVTGLISENKYSNNGIATYDGLDLLKHALSNNFVIVGRFLSTCYSKRLFEEVEGYNSIMQIMPDAYFSHKIMAINPKVIVTKKSCFSYRIHQSNNYASIFNHVRLAMDAYVMTNLYNDKFLSSIGKTKAQIKRNYVNYFGNVTLISSLKNLRISYAFKLWHLMWATYPAIYKYHSIAWLFIPILPFLSILAIIKRKLR